MLDRALYAMPTEVLEETKVLDTTSILRKAIDIARVRFGKENKDVIDVSKLLDQAKLKGDPK